MGDGAERVAMETSNTETTPSRPDIIVPSPLKKIKWRVDCTAIWFQLTSVAECNFLLARA
jgi:hypothetical protein